MSGGRSGLIRRLLHKRKKKKYKKISDRVHGMPGWQQIRAESEILAGIDVLERCLRGTLEGMAVAYKPKTALDELSKFKILHQYKMAALSFRHNSELLKTMAKVPPKEAKKYRLKLFIPGGQMLSEKGSTRKGPWKWLFDKALRRTKYPEVKIFDRMGEKALFTARKPEELRKAAIHYENIAKEIESELAGKNYSDLREKIEKDITSLKETLHFKATVAGTGGGRSNG